MAGGDGIQGDSSQIQNNLLLGNKECIEMGTGGFGVLS